MLIQLRRNLSTNTNTVFSTASTTLTGTSSTTTTVTSEVAPPPGFITVEQSSGDRDAPPGKARRADRTLSPKGAVSRRFPQLIGLLFPTRDKKYPVAVSCECIHGRHPWVALYSNTCRHQNCPSSDHQEARGHQTHIHQDAPCIHIHRDFDRQAHSDSNRRGVRCYQYRLLLDHNDDRQHDYECHNDNSNHNHNHYRIINTLILSGLRNR